MERERERGGVNARGRHIFLELKQKTEEVRRRG